MQLQISLTPEEVKMKDMDERGLWIAQVQAAWSRANEPRAVKERQQLDDQRHLMHRHFRFGM